MGQFLRIAAFASHGGSNLQSLIDACQAGRIDGEIVAVISNNRKAFALERAATAGIKALHLSEKQFDSREEYVAAITRELSARDVNLICLAGYMKFLPKEIIEFVHGHVLNIHPALLPKYGGEGMYGIHVHEAVLAAGDKETGVTVHLVDQLYDHGRILAQTRVPVEPGDTPESLQKRVLKSEHQFYPEVVARIARGEIILE
ncbi:MAG: phosphoribosylglycinamide formyltransferase [bacterium]